MTDPSTAAARLQVIGMTCDFAGPLRATRRHSDRPGFDRLDRTGSGCCLTVDAPDVLLEATEVNAGFRYRYARFYVLKPTITVMSHTCVRAAASAYSCLARGLVIPRASSRRARPCRHRGGQSSSPVTGSFDRRVFIASG